MEITYQHLLNYSNASFNWLRKSKDNADTKFGYAINRMSKPVGKALKPYNELFEEIDMEKDEISIRNATTDKTTGVLTYDVSKNEQGQEIRIYKYTPENLIKRNKEIRTILKEYELKLEKLLESNAMLSNIYYATEIPSDLTKLEIEAFTGIIINPITMTASTNGVEKQLAEV